MDDDELLARSRRDPAAFGAFYERHERLILGYFVGEPELAAETFAAASAWLIGIARNVLSRSLRRARVRDRGLATLRRSYEKEAS